MWWVGKRLDVPMEYLLLPAEECDDVMGLLYQELEDQPT
jgi:hypothetical protein